MLNLLLPYYNKTKYSNDVFSVIWKDIEALNDPYDANVTYGGRGDSRKFSFTEWLVPEFTNANNKIFYIHDKMYELWQKGLIGYSKVFADKLMYIFLKLEGFIFAYPYYLSVRAFG